MRGRALPDPAWKARQAYIRATRRGSKKHSTPAEKLALLDAATAAIPQRAPNARCPFCAKTFPDNVAWVAHVREVHPAEAQRMDRNAR
jgi:hypothetical protein